MSKEYVPEPNSNIGLILNNIPKNKVITRTELKKILSKKVKDFPVQSMYVHIKFLKEKNLIFEVKKDNESYYSKTESIVNKIAHQEDFFSKSSFGEDSDENNEQLESTEKKSNKSICVLKYCQSKIGKRIISKEVVRHCGKSIKDTAPLDALRRLREAGVIQRIPDTSPHEYLVLPDIKPLNKIPTILQSQSKNLTNSVIQTNSPPKAKNMHQDLANMTISDILKDYVEVKAENQRLKESLQRMGIEFLQLGILEHE